MSARALFAVLAGAVATSAAHASFHLMQVEQVIGGVNGDTTVQAIQLRMRSAGQNLVSQARLVVRDANGTNPITVVDLTSNVANSGAGGRVLIATSNLPSFTSPPLTPDFIITTPIPASYLDAGTLTYESDAGIVYWRVSWGGATYTGPGTGSTSNDVNGDFNPPYPRPLPRCTLESVRFRFGSGSLSTNNANDYESFLAPVLTKNNGSTSMLAGPAAATGACCAGNGCTVASSCNCAAMGGSYQGDGIACSPAQCPLGPPLDEDGDGVDELLDCDDRNAQAWTVASDDLLVSLPSESSITWTPPTEPGATTTLYDVLRSSAAGNFDPPAAVCLADDTLAASLAVPAIPSPGGAFYYLVRAQNACGDGGLGTSSAGYPRTGTACAGQTGCSVTIIRSPQAVAVCAGEDSHFSILAAGSGTHYQWKKNGVNVGSDSPALTLAAVPAGDNGAQITCIVTDSNCSRTSSTAVLTVFATAASCSGGGTGFEAPNGAHTPPDGPDPAVHPEKNGGEAYLHSGEFHLEATDLHILGRGFDFVWSRKYRSREGRLTTMGEGWDFSYNRMVTLDADGMGRFVYDGNSRRDDYRPTGAGCWAATGSFRSLCLLGDGTHVLTFPNRTTWTFASLSAPVAPGKILQVMDRNGNTMLFSYDASGRLSAITDTLGRTITVSYNPNGFITELTDFMGRHVTYGYFGPADSGGTTSDLKSVTTPAVAGQQPGNNYPNGKTTIYSYSKDMALPALNHNLLTVTDPLGKTYIRNIYTTAENPSNQRFDRLDRQRLPSGVIAYVYVQQTPSPGNNQAVTKTIVNDRAGNVREVFFNVQGQAVMLRAFTGRAPDPSIPTDDTFNRPVSPLRPSDPSFFETRYVYDANSLLTQVTFPEGHSIQHTYDAGSPDVRSRANRLQTVRSPGIRGGDQPQILETWSYGSSFASEPCPTAGICAEGKVSGYWTSHTDPRENTTTRVLDTDNGNLLREEQPLVTIGVLGGGSQLVADEWAYNSFGQTTTHRSRSGRLDTYTYYNSGPQSGYLEEFTLDFDGDGTPGGNLNLATSYIHDTAGNTVQLTDPRGHSSHQTYNQLDQLVHTIGAAPFLFETDIFLDANDRPIRHDVQNVDDRGVIQPNDRISSYFQYDALDRFLGGITEVDIGTCGPSGCAATQLGFDYQLDRNDHQARKRLGESFAGGQPQNTEHRVHDERDLLFRAVRAQGHSLHSTSERDYDKNGNLIEHREDLESAPRITRYQYDGYDRRISVTDPEGNVTLLHYDAAGNLLSERVEGERIEGESGANVRLKELSRTYDEINRLVREDVAYFDTETGLPIGDGYSTKRTFFSAGSQVIRIEGDDSSRAAEMVYDSADRQLRVTDGLGNTKEYAYDENSNILSVVETDVSELGSPSRRIETNATYDSLNRLMSVSDNAANVNQYSYDSRSNTTLLVDAKGNRTRWIYDGAGRLLRLEKDLTSTGDGTGAFVSSLVTSMSYDNSSRLLFRTDPKGNATGYLYDPLNRVTRMTNADGTFCQYSYDVHGNLTGETDPNGNVITSTYDLLDRLRTKAIARGPDILGSTFEIRKYDGLSRLVVGQDDDTLVTWAYDSLSNVIKEEQTLEADPTRTISAAFDGDRKRTSLIYPSGRTVATTYDALRRIKSISQGGPVATYHYIGPYRIERTDYGNGVRELLSYDAVRRSIRTTHERIAPHLVVDDRSYSWDPMYNKVSRTDLRPGGSVHTYAYDSAYRMRSSTGPAGAITYTLDGASNRSSVAGGPDAGSYPMSPATPEPADFQTNQYSSTPSGTRHYDSNGNLLALNSDSVHIAYDYANRMVRHDGPSGTSDYAYDVLGRRLGGAGQKYVFDGWREIEERDAAGTLTATYVYGEYPDDVLRQERDVDADGTLDLLFHHTDDLHNVMAITNAFGAPLERYDFDDFGAPRFFDPAGAEIPGSAIGNPVLFTGRRYDKESGLYYYRARYLDPRAGRFTTRDPLGCTTDDCNLVTYAKTSPFRWQDPSGLKPGIFSDSKDMVIVDNPTKHLKYDQWDSLKRMKQAFVDGNLPAEFDPCIDGGKAASIKEVRKVLYVTTLKVAMDQAVEYLENADGWLPSSRLYVLEFWGHGNEGVMEAGDDDITKDSFQEGGELAKLKPYIIEPGAGLGSKIYFKGCSTFGGDAGREFAKEATKFFKCRVAGHTVCIGYGLEFPGYVELKPGEDPAWEDDPKAEKKRKKK